MIFSRIVALDRALRRVPSIIEIWFLEFLALIPLSLGIGHWLNGVGAGGCPPAPSGIDGTGAGFILVGALFGVFAVRRILRPKVSIAEWTPVHHAGPLIVAQSAARVRYAVLSSHPSYALVHLLTAPLPLVGVLALAERNCGVSFFPLFGAAAFALLAALVLLRLVSWHGLRLGRDAIEANLPPGWSARRLEWELAWRPMLTTVILIGSFIVVPMAYFFAKDWLGYGM